MSDAKNQDRPETSLDSSTARELYRVLVEEAADGIFITDLHGRYIAINPRGTELTGYSCEELLGMNISELIPPEDLAREPIRMDDLRQGNIVVKERRIRRKDGSLLPAEVSIRMLPTGNLLGIVHNISERKRAEEQMLVANERLQYLLSSTSAVIYTAKPSGDFGATFISSNVAQMVGYDPEEFIRDSNFWYDHVHPENRMIVSEEVLRVFEEELHAYEYRFKHRDGRYIWVRDEMRLVRDNNGDPLEIIGFWVDVTDRKLAEEEKEKLQGQLLQAKKMESVGRLAGGLAHDFNNMLSVILGHAELAMMQCTPSEPIHADLKEIEKTAQRFADLTRQLLAFARKQTVLPKVLDLNGTVASTLKMLQRLIGENIDLVWMPGAGLWRVKIDPSQIDQLLANLCLNARDAITGMGKVTIETGNTAFDEAYCALHPGFACGEYVTLIVSDDGCGINKEVIDHVFEPFFTTKEVGKGTGLGLATVYGIVKQNEGFIDVHSEPDKGATFKIYLPRFVGEAVEPKAESTAETPKSHGETVLLVEDDADILNVGRRTLERLGYTVLTAGTPGEALRQAKAHAAEIRLLITDVVMPEMNGRALAKLISDIKPGLKCLFTSGYTANVIAHHGVLDEDVYFLQKPFSLKELASKVRQALECD